MRFHEPPYQRSMSFFAFGFNYESARVQVRDAFALDVSTQTRLYEVLTLEEGSEFVLLSTCNRTEVYLYGTEADVQGIKNAIGIAVGIAWDEEASFMYHDEAAVWHVLRVTSGLKSMVLGDGQILSQVKEAYRLAVHHDRVGAVLHRLMHTAFRAAKRVATETGVTSGAVSVGAAAVAMARNHLEDGGRNGLAGSRIVVLGAGQMSRLILQVLRKQPVRSLILINRTEGRGSELAAAVGAQTVPWEERYGAIRDADVVLAATSSPSPVIEAESVLPKAPGARDTLLIDIGTPRNVEPAVGRIAGHRVLDLDTLNAWIRRTEAHRRAETPAAEAICDELLSEFVAWMFHQQALQPGIQAIRETFEAIRRREIERHHHRFSDTDREELDVLTRSIMQKLLAVPVVRLKSVSPESIDFVNGIRLLQYLFSRPRCDDAPEGETLAEPDRLLPREQAAGDDLLSRWLADPDSALSAVLTGPEFAADTHRTPS